MDFNLNAEQRAYQDHVRAWAQSALPTAPRRKPTAGGKPSVGSEPPAETKARYQQWQAARAEAKLTCVMWPEAYGGAGKGPVEHYIVSKEIDTLDVVPPINIVGFGIVLPSILYFGTEAQKSTHLTAAVRGEHVWCQLFSEPGCGSDLAGLKSRAVPEGRGWRLNGQKIWTSFAHYADYGLALVRTDPDSRKHRGLTMFVIDLHAPGVTVRPIRFGNGDVTFNEVFFDNVQLQPEDVVGEVDEGWKVAIGTLMGERGTSNIHLHYGPWLDKVLRLARERIDPADTSLGTQHLRARLARLIAHGKIMELQGLRVLSGATGGAPPGPEGSFVKMLWSEANQELSSWVLDLVGPAGALLEGAESVLGSVAGMGEETLGEGADMPEWGYFPKAWLRSFGNTLEGGSSEILRNIVAERILGLPKDPSRVLAAAPTAAASSAQQAG